MKNVLRLAAKDIRQQRSFLGALVAFQVVSAAILYVQFPATVPSQVWVMILQLLGWVAGFVFCFRTIVAEEKNRAFFFLKTLPITDVQLALGKFASNLALVSLNFFLIFTLYTAVGALGLMAHPATISISFLSLLFSTQVFNNFFFLATSLLFDSEKAVWIPFPFIWVVATLLGNIDRVTKALGLGRFWDFALDHIALIAAGILTASAALVGVTVLLFSRRRRFG